MSTLNPDIAFSQGDVMRRLAAIERRMGEVQAIAVRGSIPATTIGAIVGPEVRSADVATMESTASAAYTDLTTFGPQVTALVGESGNALVILTCAMDLQASESGRVSFEISGATVQPTDDNDRVLSLAAGTSGVAATFSRVIEVTGLNPGANTFTMKYRSAFGGTVDFADRNVTVVPF